MLNRLSARLTLALTVILAVTCGAWLALTLFATRLYQEEVDQSLNSPLAHYIAKAYPLISDGLVNRDSLTGLFDQLMVINPRIEVYLLDLEGNILAFSAEPGRVKREQIDLQPVRSWIAGSETLPLRGDDPRDPGGRKPFSAAEVYDGERHAGYLYVVLEGEEYESAAGLLASSYILRLAIGTGAIGVLVAIGAGILSFAWLTRRLRRLSEAVEAFRKADFETPVNLANWRRGGDEIDRLGVAVEEMSQRIADQIEQLRRADATRRDMVANISHDLRTPLASLQGYLETLSMKQDSFSEAQKSRYLDLAVRQGDRLARLIAELFELAMLDSTVTPPNFEAFSLGELVQDVAQKFRPDAERKRLHLETEIPETAPFVRADIGLIERVLENLIENAIKYTPEGGSVRLSLAVGTDGIEMRVADTGQGIDADDRERIFERFYRAEKSRGEGPDGTGLGLAITQRILQLHDCPIRVESVLGKGTAFTFRLPLAQS
ncbi:MAG: HAMP domain-containing protein [Rhodospirillales bacterium]|nr:MAG: HAMP domain-containing protein [Rhodospirillales bacterium]